jgi:diaminopimelate epimerase
MTNDYGRFSATGNTFQIVGDRTLSRQAKSRLAAEIAASASVDGVVFFDPKQVSMRIFDCDGTYEPMCGNALRATAYLALELGVLRRGIFTDDGFKEVVSRDGALEVEIGAVQRAGDLHIVAGIVHLVAQSLAETEARILRQQRNANITCLDAMQRRYRTFERGVERFTESCGTGAVACADALALRNATFCAPGGIVTVRAEGQTYFIGGEVRYVGNS